MASIWELFVRLSGDNSNFKQSFKESGGILSDFEKQAESSGAKILGALSFGALAAGAIASAEKFQEAGFTIARSTGATGERLAGLNEAFKDLYATSASSAEVIADSVSTIARETGAAGKQLESLTKANLQFAKVTRTDVKEAIDATQVAFKQWGISASEQAGKLDVLYKVQTLTGISTANLGAEMAATGPTARAYGFTFEENVALIGAFEEAGLKASDMVRGMNAAFIKFAEAGKDPKQALTDLIDKLKDTKNSAAAAKQLIDAGFSSRSVVAMADAARRGALDFGELAAKLEDASGSVSEMAKSTTTLGAEITKLYHNVQSYLADPGPGVLSWLTKAIAGFNDLASKVGLVTALFGGGRGAALALQDALATEAYHKANLAGQTFGAKPSAGAPGGGGADPNAIPATLRAGTLDTLVGVEILNQEQAALKAVVTQFAEWRIKGRDVAAVSSDISKQTLDLSQNFHHETNELGEVIGVADRAGTALEIYAKSIAQVADAPDWSKVHDGIKRTDELMAALGLSSTHAFQAVYEGALLAEKELYLLFLQGDATSSDLRAGAEAVAQAHKDLNQVLNGTTAGYNTATTSGKKFAQQVSSAVHDLAKSLASVVIGEKSIGDAFKEVGKTIVRIILEDIISNAIGKLLKALSGLLSSLGGVGKAIGGILGGGSSAAGGAVSGGGGAAGAATSAASGGVGSIIGLVTGGIQAVSSVIGNFQFAGMNKSLDLIVKHTLQTANDMANLRRDLWDQHNGMRAITNMIYDRMGDMWGTLRSGGGTAGKSAVTFNNCTFTGSPQQIADAIFTQAALAGAIFT